MRPTGLMAQSRWLQRASVSLCLQPRVPVPTSTGEPSRPPSRAALTPALEVQHPAALGKPGRAPPTFSSVSGWGPEPRTWAASLSERQLSPAVPSPTRQFWRSDLTLRP